MSKENIANYLKKFDHLQLGTVDENGQPMVHTVSHVSDGSNVYFMTDSRTRKANNLMANPKVAFAVNADHKDWNEIQGVQMIGEAALITDENEVNQIMGMFAEKFPNLHDLPEDFDMRLFKIEPRFGIYIDNTASFGYRENVEY
jgi:uncharacterized protein YhbP (UPF0306 family)